MTNALPAGADLAFSQQPLLSRGATPAVTSDRAAAQATAQEFEAVFVAQMLNHMFAGIDTGGPFGGGHAEQTWRSMLIENYGRQITQAGGIGIADQVMAQILNVQEMQHEEPSG